MPKPLPSRPSLPQLRSQAKELLVQLKSGDIHAWNRLRQVHSKFSGPSEERSLQPALHHAQLVIARELGFPSWPKMKKALETSRDDRDEKNDVDLLEEVFIEVTRTLPHPLRIRSVIESFADALQQAHQASQRWAFVVLSNYSPSLVAKLPQEIFGAEVHSDHARETAARYFGFKSWAEAEQRDQDVVDTEFESAVSAVIQGNTERLRALIEGTPALVHQRSHWGHRATLLHYIAANGVEIHRQRVSAKAVDVARMLLEAGAEVDALAETYGGGPDQTTLSLLITSGHPHEANLVAPLLSLLAEFGCRLDGVDRSGRPLKTVVDFGYTQTAMLMVQLGASVFDLETAAGTGNLDTMRRILNSAPDPDKKASALYLAARNGQSEAVTLLLDHEADPNARGWFKGTALQWAAINGFDTIVQKLVAAGADPNLRDERFKAHAAGWANEGGHETLRDWLLDHGCSVSLTEAVAFNRIDLVDEILQRDPASVREHPGRTPLHEAASRGHMEILERLLASGADPLARDEAGFKPIDWARRFQREIVIQRLESLES